MAHDDPRPSLSAIAQLAASVGHELRNPLGVIESSLYLAQRQLQTLGVADPQVEKHLGKIALEVARARQIIEDLLDLARRRPLRRQRTALVEVVAAARASVAEAPGVAVTVDVPTDAQVDADRDQLARALGHLLQNAHQALAGRGGALTVSGGRADGGAWLRVADDGPGVPAALRERLFEPLVSGRPQGTGLGLALCRQVLEAHGGTVVLEETAAGASFLLRVPDAV